MMIGLGRVVEQESAVGYGQLLTLLSLLPASAAFPSSSSPAMQAYQQGYAAQANKGTLVPGQSITVNKYTVVVERYLSQGLCMLVARSPSHLIPTLLQAASPTSTSSGPLSRSTIPPTMFSSGSRCRTKPCSQKSSSFNFDSSLLSSLQRSFECFDIELLVEKAFKALIAIQGGVTDG